MAKSDQERPKNAPSSSFAKPGAELKEESNDVKAKPTDTTLPGSDDAKKPTFSFAKPDEKKEGAEPSTPAFSFAKSEDKKEDGKPSAPAFSFAKPENKKEDGKPSAPAFSFAKPEDKKEDGKPSMPSFSFTKPEDKKEDGKPSAPAFSFAKSEDKKEDGKQSAPAFSFARPEDKKEDGKPNTPSFSFAKPEDKKEDGKPSAPAFSFAKPEDKKEDGKPSMPSFSFAKPEDKKEDGKPSAPAFSFAKSEDKKEDGKPSAPAFSFAKPEDKKDDGKPSAPSFSFAKPEDKEDGKPGAPSFSFAKPEDKKEDGKPSAPAFSFAKPEDKKEDGKPNTPSFSFAKPEDKKEDGKPSAPAFSFAKPEDKKDDNKPSAPSIFATPEEKKSPFSFAKPQEKGEDSKPFTFSSFAKPGEAKTPSFSFAKPKSDGATTKAMPQGDGKALPNHDEKTGSAAPAFSFAKNEDASKPNSSFSFAKPGNADAPASDAKQGEPSFSFGKASDTAPAASAPAWKTSATAASDKTATPAAPARVQGILLDDVRVPKVHLPSVATPDVSDESGELQREFVKVYLSVNAELKALYERASELGRFVDEVQQRGGEKHVDDLQDPASWTFGDLPSLASVARALQMRIEDTERAVTESQQRVSSIQSVQLKGEIKRDEAARFLRARKDPSFAKLVHVRHLGPEHMENQQRLRRTTHMVRERMQELEDYLHTIKTTVANEKSGRSSLRPPSLDSVYRSTEHISTLAARRLAELDRLGAELKELRPGAATPAPLADENRMLTPRKTSAALDSLQDLHTTLPEATEADGEAEWAAHVAAMDTVLQVRTTPVVTEATASSVRAEGMDAPVILHRAPSREATPPPPASAPAAPTAAPAEPAPKPSRPDFLATKTPDGVRAPTPQARTVAHAPAHGGAAIPATHTSGPTYTTFEGLVPPRPVSPPQNLTLEQYVEQELSDGYEDDDDFDDYGEDEDDEDDYDEEDDEDEAD
ncbi:hypothetical protein MBRA1_001817 [Malassezia brasiliensis]|uniref:Uncharacterized protein n=1 Tax=Malassezia brasiliensis TaxID=1821822 RepID=A0AAF0DWZ3_9BASI|nr:hypothetical protein MBRA1_001817 [Malassezia brasiliensis]